MFKKQLAGFWGRFARATRKPACRGAFPLAVELLESRDVPTTTTPTMTDPTGPVSGNAANFSLQGTAEANSLIRVYRDTGTIGVLDGETALDSQQLTAGATTFSISVSLNQDAVNHFLVTADNGTDGESDPAVVTITEDSQTPAAPVLTSPITPITVDSPTVTISGTAEAGALITVYRDVNNNGTFDAGDTEVTAQQQLGPSETSFSLQATLTQNAANQFFVTAKDAAGNESTEATTAVVTEDSQVPAAPSVFSPTAPTSVNSTTFTVIGTAEAGSFVQIYRDANNNGVVDGGDTVVGSQQLASGSTLFSPSVPILPGANHFLATAKDAAGHESAPAVVATITQDTAAPTVTITPAAGHLLTTAGTRIVYTVVFSEPVFGFTSAGVRAGGTAGATTATVTESGPRNGTTFTLAITGMTRSGTVVPILLDGAAQDAAGNFITATGGASVMYRSSPILAVATVKDSQLTIRVFDSQTHARLLTIPVADAAFRGKVSLATGDVNGDGVADVVVASKKTGQVQVFDGTTGKLLKTFSAVQNGGSNSLFVRTFDANHDGFADIVVGLALSDTQTRLQVFSGRDEKVLADLTQTHAAPVAGVLQVGGDVTGDGVADIVTAKQTGNDVLIRVQDGATGKEVASFTTTSPLYASDVRMSLADVDDDGKMEILLVPVLDESGLVRIFSIEDPKHPIGFTAFDSGGRDGFFIS